MHHVRDKNHALVHQGILVFVIHNNDVQSDYVWCWSRQFVPLLENRCNRVLSENDKHQYDRQVKTGENWLEVWLTRSINSLASTVNRFLHFATGFSSVKFFNFSISFFFSWFWFDLDSYPSPEFLRYFFTIKLRNILFSFTFIAGFCKHVRVTRRINFFPLGPFNLRLIFWSFIQKHGCLIPK